MTKTTKEERDEIRLLEARATLGPWLPSESTRVPKVLDRDGGLVCEFDTVNGKNDREAVAAMRNIVPDLLADLDAAEAKLEAVTDVPDDIHDAIEELAESAYAWADSDTEPVSELAAKERIADSRLRVMVSKLLAQRDRAESELDAERRMRVEAEAASDRAESERATAESIAAQATARMEEMRAERDAASTAISHAFAGSAVIGTTLAERVDYLIGFSKEVEASRCGMVDETASTRKERDALKAKLAALVKAADPFACDQGCDAVHHPFRDRHDQRDNCPVVARLRAAIAAARGGES